MTSAKCSRAVSMLLAICILVGLLPLRAQAVYSPGGSSFIISVEPIVPPDGYEVIANAAGLEAIREDPGKNYILVCDIDLSSISNWTPISEFSGILDGNGYRISGLAQKVEALGSAQGYSGLIQTNRGTIKNLGIDGCSISLSTEAGVAFGGGLVATNSGRIENCYIFGQLEATVQTPEISAIGAICAYNTGSGTVTACHSLCDITVLSGKNAETQLEVGGIAGESQASVKSSVNSGTIRITNQNGQTYAAGVVGKTPAAVSDCGNLGNIFVKEASGTIYLGGITSIVSGYYSVDRCFNYGNIQAEANTGDAYAGGIAALFNVDDGTTTSGCNYNDGAVSAAVKSSSATAAAGGIAGVLQGYYHLRNSYNNGDIRADSTGSKASAGGITGLFIQSISYASIEYVYNTGRIDCSNAGAFGGIVGSVQYSWYLISNCIKYAYSINSSTLLGSSSKSEIIENTCANYNATPDSMKSASSFRGFDFSSIWTMGDGEYPYPSFKSNPRIVPSESEDPDFNLLIYRADSITNGDYDISTVYYDYAMTNKYSPSGALVEALGPGMTALEVMWDTITGVVEAVETGGLSIIKNELDKKDIYGALLLDVLQCESNLTFTRLFSDQEWFNKTQQQASNFKKAIKENYSITDDAQYYKWLEKRANEDAIAEECSNCMNNIFTEKDPATDYSYFSQTVIDTATNLEFIKGVFSRVDGVERKIENVLNQCMTYAALMQLSESMKDTICKLEEKAKERYGITHPAYSALREIKNIVSLTTQEELGRYQRGEYLVSVGKNGVKWAHGILWGNVMKGIQETEPWMGYCFALYHLGKGLMDATLKGEKSFELYFKMNAMLDLEEIVNASTLDYYQSYTHAGGTLEKQTAAALLLDMIEVKSKFLHTDGKTAVSYCKLPGAGHNLESVQTMCDTINQTHFTINTAWLNQLRSEHPELLRNYTGYWIEAWKECLDKYPDYYLDDAIDYTYFLKNKYSQGESIEIACPVDVYIYDEEDQLVAYAANGAVYAEEGGNVLLDGDVKQFYFTDQGKYRIECKGYEQGEMNITLINYQDDEVSRVTNFNRVEVSGTSTHSLQLDLGAQDTQKLTLTDSAGSTMQPAYDSLAPASETYHILVNNGYLTSEETVSYDCSLSAGQTVTLTPVAPDGFQFVKWTSDCGDTVFNDPEDMFCKLTMPGQNVVVNAEFVETSHDFSVPQYDEDNHWLKCSRCDEKSGVTAHSFPAHSCDAAVKCSGCDYMKPAGEHSYGEYVQTTAPTCTAAGEETRTCSVCQHKQTREVAALTHDFSVPQYNEDNHWLKCSRCDEKSGVTAHSFPAHSCDAAVKCSGCDYMKPAGEHSYGEYVQTTAPTCTAAGEETRTCTICSHQDSRTIAASGHTKGQPVHENEVPATKDKEGHYDEVVYCTVCKTELSRVTRIIPKLVDDIDAILPILPIIGKPGTASKFPFRDVPASAWYYDAVKSAWEVQLIDGVTSTEFRPDANMTVAQAIKLASVLHQMTQYGKVTLRNGAPNWYSTYVSYAIDSGLIESTYGNYTAAQMNSPVTRAEFVHIFHAAVDDLRGMNTVTDNAIPDVKTGDAFATEIYDFYRAGILTGSDVNGTFHPADTIKRSEVAAILIRMYDSSARKSIALG